MCGICGFAAPAPRADSRAVLERMTRTLAHRGPDGDGCYVSGGVALGHRRLAIIDLDGGAQPIANEDASVTIVYNGEVFNYRELTKDLIARGHVFRTHSDTETLVHLYEEYGIGMLERLQGMFAFALYDAKREALYLVRDRFGIKPLYYHCTQGALAFASEIRALIAAGCPVEVNRAGVHAFLQTRFAHGDETMFKGVFRLPAGTYLEWKRGAWTIVPYYTNPVAAPHQRIAHADAEALLESSFTDAVRAWMIADVPVGAYLSGGVDSSLLVSEMVRLTNHSIRTFCVDFPGATSEAADAERTATALGCTHTTVWCGVDELLALPDVVDALEEPVGDAVVVAQYFLSRATRDAGIKTVLTGDGADETLGGYQYLRAIVQAVRWGGTLPAGVLRLGSTLARRLPLALVEALADVPLGVAEDARVRLVEVLRAVPRKDLMEVYDLLVALYLPDELDEIYSDGFKAETRAFARDRFAGEPSGTTLTERVLSMQFRKWLPANINMKQDKLAMAHSVENRVPFLDHRFVEAMAAVPDDLKIRGMRGKVLLRQFAKRRVPNGVVARTKVPFHLPLGKHLADPRVWEMVEDTVSDERIRRRGYLRPEYVRSLKERARQGDYLLSKKLMALVILELWHQRFVDRAAA